MAKSLRPDLTCDLSFRPAMFSKKKWGEGTEAQEFKCRWTQTWICPRREWTSYLTQSRKRLSRFLHPIWKTRVAQFKIWMRTLHLSSMDKFIISFLYYCHSEIISKLLENERIGNWQGTPINRCSLLLTLQTKGTPPFLGKFYMFCLSKIVPLSNKTKKNTWREVIIQVIISDF